jgi:hypothetical protein
LSAGVRIPTSGLWKTADTILSGKLAASILELYGAGQSPRQIATELSGHGIYASHATVAGWIDLLAADGEPATDIEVARASLADRLDMRSIRQPDGCWTWAGAHDPTGYGVVFGTLDGGKRRKLYTHRVAYTLHVGPIPEGLDIDHLCRNRGCCNPEHLEAVTRRENLMRGETLAAYHSRGEVCPFEKCKSCRPRREAAA